MTTLSNMSTGIYLIDQQMIAGPDHLTILLGTPGSYKSTLLYRIAAQQAKRGINVLLVCNPERSKMGIFEGVEPGKVTVLSPTTDFDRFLSAKEKKGIKSIFIDDTNLLLNRVDALKPFFTRLAKFAHNEEIQIWATLQVNRDRKRLSDQNGPIGIDEALLEDVDNVVFITNHRLDSGERYKELEFVKIRNRPERWTPSLMGGKVKIFDSNLRETSGQLLIQQSRASDDLWSSACKTMRILQGMGCEVMLQSSHDEMEISVPQGVDIEEVKKVVLDFWPPEQFKFKNIPVDVKDI